MGTSIDTYVSGLGAAADHLLAMAQDLEQIIARIKTQADYASTQTAYVELHTLGDHARLLRAQSKQIRAGRELLTPRAE